MALWAIFSMRGGFSVGNSWLDCGFIPLLHFWFTEITVRVPKGTIQELFSTLEAGCGVLTSILWI